MSESLKLYLDMREVVQQVLATMYGRPRLRMTWTRSGEVMAYAMPHVCKDKEKCQIAHIPRVHDVLSDLFVEVLNDNGCLQIVAMSADSVWESILVWNEGKWSLSVDNDDRHKPALHTLHAIALALGIGSDQWDELLASAAKTSQETHP